MSPPTVFEEFIADIDNYQGYRDAIEHMKDTIREKTDDISKYTTILFTQQKYYDTVLDTLSIYYAFTKDERMETIVDYLLSTWDGLQFDGDITDEDDDRETFPVFD